jgi:hypothetical protein
VIEACRHQRPVMPSQAFFMRELDRAVDAARFDRIAPPDKIAIVAPDGTAWAEGLRREAESAGVAVTSEPGSAPITIADFTMAGGPPIPSGARVVAVTDAPDPPEGAAGYLAPPVSWEQVRRWWVAKRALEAARDNTQRELDHILRGSK